MSGNAEEATEATDEVQFELAGLPSLSQNLVVGAQSSTTPGRLLEKDIQHYEKKAREYRSRVLADIRSKLPAGTKKFTLSHLPDPLLFWNIQVSIIVIEFSLSVIDTSYV